MHVDDNAAIDCIGAAQQSAPKNGRAAQFLAIYGGQCQGRGMHGHPPLSLLSRLPSAVAHAARRTARRGLQVTRRSPAWAIIEGSRQAGATRRVAAAERRTWRLARRIRRRTGQHAAAEWRAASGHGAGRDICRPARSVDMPLARSLRARAI